MPVTVRLVPHRASVAPQNDLALIIDAEHARCLQGAHLAHVELAAFAVVEVLIVIQILSLAHVASGTAVVSKWLSTLLLHHAATGAMDDDLGALAGRMAPWYASSLEPGDLLPSSLEIRLEDLNAIVAFDAFATALRIIGIHLLFTVFASNLEVLALLHAMIVHVFADDAEAAALPAWQELVLTLLEVVQGLLIRSGERALWQAAFELESKQILLDIPMHVVPRHGIVAEALLRA